VHLPQLKRVRWAVRMALFLGVGASVCANVLHAQPNPISQTISAWPPLALLLTVELTSRIPMHRRALAACRIGATVVIAGIAAWVSYWHMQDVATRYGETRISSYMLPISVDGLIVVASVSLVELAGRIRVVEEQLQKMRLGATAPTPAPVQFVQPAPLAAPASPPVFQTPESVPVARVGADPAAAAEVARPAAAVVETPPAPRQMTPLSQAIPVSPAVVATTRPTPAYVNGSTPPARPSVARAAVSAPPRTVVTAPTTKPAESDTPRQRRPALETAELADAIEAMDPEISQNELAKRLGISPTRLRAVRREAREATRPGSRR
jgi:Protein of unknown function (DUF2637)